MTQHRGRDTSMEWETADKKGKSIRRPEEQPKPQSITPSPSSSKPQSPVAILRPASTASSVDSEGVPNLTVKNLMQSNQLLKPRGLVNNGNLCFLNAIVQVLNHCSPFHKIFSRLASQFTPDMSYCYAMATLFKQLGDSFSTVTVGTEALQLAIRRDQVENQAFWGHLQEDAQEFLTHLLDRMHEELLGATLSWRVESESFAPESADGDDGWMEVGRAQKIGTFRRMGQAETPLSRLLFGQYRSTVKRRGSKPSHCLEPFHCLTVEMTSSLEESLERAFRAEPLEEPGMSKQLCIERLPPILIIHLKRFVYHPTHGSQKLTTSLSFPECLIFRPHWTTAEGKPCYRLASLVHHHGRGSAGGHYTASVRSSWADAHPWFRIDDGSIRQESEQFILHDQNTPYLLIYQRTRDAK